MSLLLIVLAVMRLVSGIGEYHPLGLVEFITETDAELIRTNLCNRLTAEEYHGLMRTCLALSKALEPVGQLDRKQVTDLYQLLKKPRLTVGELCGFLPATKYNLKVLDADSSKGLLYWTAFNGQSVELLDFLRRKGAEPDRIELRYLVQCLIYVTDGLRIAQYLIREGVQLYQPGEWNMLGQLILMNAVAFLEVLEAAGLIPEMINIPDDEGRTPLFHANNVVDARNLLTMGANPLHKDRYGNTARKHIAIQFQGRHQDLLALIQRAEECQEG